MAAAQRGFHPVAVAAGDKAKPARAGDNRLGRPTVQVDMMTLAVREASGAVRLADRSVTSMVQLATRMVAIGESRCTAQDALVDELARSRRAKLLRDTIEDAVDQLVVKCSVVTSKKKSLSAKHIASGLFPALVFEYLGLRGMALGGGSSNASATRYDPLIPQFDLFNEGVVTCFVKRLTPFVHDLLRVKGDALQTQCHEISKRMLTLLVDALRAHDAAVGAPESSTSIPPLAPSASNANTAAPTTHTAHAVVLAAHGDHHTVLSCGGYVHTVRTVHFQKLLGLYVGSVPSDAHIRVFVMLQRYYGLTGCTSDPAEEGGWHGSVPPKVLSDMGALLGDGLDGECFASPLNASCTRYCSAFPDTDCFFGGVGSFFETTFVRGVYEANPPFEHATVVAMGARMATLLSSSDEPLAFVVVLPWADKGKMLGSLEVFSTSLHASCSRVVHADLVGQQTPFVDGYQQCTDACFTSRLDSKILLVQNTAHQQVLPLDAAQCALNEIVARWGALQATKRDRDGSA